MKRVLALVLLAGCNTEKWSRYDLYFQVDGDRDYEAGRSVCGVGLSARHAVWLATPETSGACGIGSDALSLSFARIVPAARLEIVTAEVPRGFLPVKVEGEGLDLVALDPLDGVAWWHARPLLPGEPADDVPQLQGVFRPGAGPVGRLVDVALHGGVAWVAEVLPDGTSALHRIDLEALDGGDAVRTEALPGLPVAVDAGPDGAVVAMPGPVDRVAWYDPDGAPGDLLEVPFDSDGVRLGAAATWVTGEGFLYAVVDGAFVDEAGTPAVDGAERVFHASGEMVFLASGRDAVSMVWDGANPGRPKAVAGYHVGDGTFDIDTAGQTLFLAAGSRGLQVWGPPRDWEDETLE